MMVTKKVINLSGEFTADELVEALCAVSDIVDELCKSAATMAKCAEDVEQREGLEEAATSIAVSCIGLAHAAHKVAYHGAGLD